MNCNFVVGQKVVCVKGAARSPYTTGGWAPKTGDTFTVRSIFEYGGEIFIRLQEYHHDNKVDFGEWGEPGWSADRFKPVERRKTDISIFKAMLNPSNPKVPA